MFRLDADLKVYMHREAVVFRIALPACRRWPSKRWGSIRLHEPSTYFAIVGRSHQAAAMGGGNGFWLLMKRLEADGFMWPRGTTMVLELTIEKLHWLLDYD